MEALFKGYFEEEKDPGNVGWLAEEAVKVGLFPDQTAAEDWLKGEEGLEKVKAGYKKAQASDFVPPADYPVAADLSRSKQSLGITGVPFFIFGNKYAVSGAQPPEAFFEVFQELVKNEL